ncbi:MAG: hypothetical protein IJO63_04790 [Bacilli bacterium]|nr:hypothetical protein [Bacilli bacterium]
MKDFFKLNKGGWGLKEMVIIVAILLSFLLIAGYYIFVLYSDMGYDVPYQYAELESRIKASAVNYVAKNNLKDSKAIISLSDMQKNGYLDLFTDSNDNECNGYVIYEDYDYKSYISCEFYKTSGYNKSYE